MADIDYTRTRKNSQTAVFWVFTAAVGLLMVIIFAVPLLLDEAGLTQGSELTISDVVDNPQLYAGQQLALQAQVDRTIGQRAFTLNGEGVVNDDMLVFSRDPLQAVGGGVGEGILFQADDQVTVLGTVRKFTVSQMEKQLGIDLKDEDYQKWNGKYVFIAETVTKIDE